MTTITQHAARANSTCVLSAPPRPRARPGPIPMRSCWPRTGATRAAPGAGRTSPTRTCTAPSALMRTARPALMSVPRVPLSTASTRAPHPQPRSRHPLLSYLGTLPLPLPLPRLRAPRASLPPRQPAPNSLCPRLSAPPRQLALNPLCSPLLLPRPRHLRLYYRHLFPPLSLRSRVSPAHRYRLRPQHPLSPRCMVETPPSPLRFN